MKLVFATNNAHKLKEVRSALQEIEILSLAEADFEGEIPEDHDTLEANSHQKASYILEHTGFDCFADDTGLEVDALNGAPGVYSARYAGENCTFLDNVNKLLREMQGKENRAARFRTVVTLLLDGELYQFEGVCEGQITREPAGAGGFGYDPIFKPAGYDVTFAELDLAEKNRISHRGLAVQKLVEFLRERADNT
jgi:XTP/dITP diphosphohydrolase